MQKKKSLPFLFRPKILDVFKEGYDKKRLVSDSLAGITVGLIALPLSMALGIASIPANTHLLFSPPAIGIFTAIIAGLLVALFGGTHVQIAGPTAAFVPIVLLIIEKYGYLGLIISTFMAGIFLIVMGITRMGSFIKYIPWPVTSGFTSGIAVSIMMTQVVDFCGISSKLPHASSFFEKLSWLYFNIEKCNLSTLSLSLTTLAIILFWPKFGIKKIPGSIIAMILVTLAATFFDLHKLTGIATVGSTFGTMAIPSTLPSFHIPSINLALIHDLINPAITIALLCAIESLLSSVVADGLINDRHDSNTELIAQGITNIFSPFFGGLPATGAIARTSANINNGGRSPVAGIVHSLTLLLIVLLFSHYAIYIPMAVMAAILIAVSLHMGEWHEFKRLHRMPLSDALVLVTTFSLTVIFDLVIAVEVGMILAAMLFIHRISRTTEVTRVTDDDVLQLSTQVSHGKKIPEDVVVYRIFGPFLFGAAEKMKDALSSIGALPKVFILKMHLVTAMDATALNALESIVESIKITGGTVIICGIRHQPLKLLRKAQFINTIGRNNFCSTFDKSLERANQILSVKAVPNAY